MHSFWKVALIVLIACLLTGTGSVFARATSDTRHIMRQNGAREWQAGTSTDYGLLGCR